MRGSELLAPGPFHDHGLGLGWLLHAAVWHLVGRLLWRVPLPVDVGLVVVGFLLYRSGVRALWRNPLGRRRGRLNEAERDSGRSYR